MKDEYEPDLDAPNVINVINEKSVSFSEETLPIGISSEEPINSPQSKMYGSFESEDINWLKRPYWFEYRVTHG